MTKIALAMIVKGSDDEALMLDRCLDSLYKHVDKIYITRTQKQGEAKNAAVANVARNYNAVLSDFEWVDDFSKARSFNFSQVPKEYDWIMWTDADDVWRGAEKLRETLEKAKHVDGFGFWYLYDWDEFKKPVVVHRKTMIIRNDGCAEWVGAIHEDLQPKRGVEIHLVEGIERLHLTSKKRSAENAERNLLISKKEVKEKNDDPRSYWNLANAFFAVADFEASKRAFIEFIETSESNEELYLAHTRLSNVYKALGDRNSSIRELQTAIGMSPTIPDAYLQLAAYYFDYDDMDNAEQYCLQGLLKKPQIMKMVVYNPRDYDYNPMMLLAKIYYRKNRPDLALPLLEGCLKIYPKDETLKNLVKEAKREKKELGKALETVVKLQKIKDKEKLRKALEKIPLEIRSHPAIAVIRNQNFVKERSSGKDISIYCGNTVKQWHGGMINKEMVGGSEEAVIHLAKEYVKAGWNVVVYNNCGHKELVAGGVVYKPFWEFNYRDKQDVVILWRWAKPLDAPINSPKIFLDLHDVIPEGELNEKRVNAVTKIFVKTKFHRSLFPNVPDEKFCIVPNGLEIYKDETIKKDPYLIINTSSPDRSLDVLPKLFGAVKKQVPEAKLQWAYGWDGFISTHSRDQKKMAWMEKVNMEMQVAGIEVLGRLPQNEVGKLYQKASVLAYPTEFAEIDCISVKKAQAADCFPITSDFGALAETNQFGHAVHSTKTKDNWAKPYQFHFGLEGEAEQQLWVELMVSYLKGKPMLPVKTQGKEVWLEQFKWENVAKKWLQQFI